jgi:hypothetical protein
LKVKFSTQTATGFPIPLFGNTPVDVYQNNTAIVDTGGAMFFSDIGRISDLKTITDNIAPLIGYSHTELVAKAPFSGELHLYRIGRTVTMSGYAVYSGVATTVGMVMFENIPPEYTPADIDVAVLARVIPVGVTNGANLSGMLAVNPTTKYIQHTVTNSLVMVSVLPNSTADAAIINIHPITYIAEN